MQSRAESYAQLQGSLRRSYFQDLLQMRNALSSVMKELPHRGEALKAKVMLLDGAVALLTTPKHEVNDFDMAALVDVGPKVQRVCEQWRSRLKQRAAEGRPIPLSAPFTNGEAHAQLATPFQQPAAPLSPQPQQQPEAACRSDSAERALHLLHDLERLDSIDFLLDTPAAGTDAGPPLSLSLGTTLLPTIDWDVPMIKPSGNLDQLLASEASEVLQLQQMASQPGRAQTWPAAAPAGPERHNSRSTGGTLSGGGAAERPADAGYRHGMDSMDQGGLGAQPSGNAYFLLAQQQQAQAAQQAAAQHQQGVRLVHQGSHESLPFMQPPLGGGGGGSFHQQQLSGSGSLPYMHPLSGHSGSIHLQPTSSGGTLVTTGITAATARPPTPASQHRPDPNQLAWQHSQAEAQRLALEQHAFSTALYRQHMHQLQAAHRPPQQAQQAAGDVCMADDPVFDATK